MTRSLWLTVAILLQHCWSPMTGLAAAAVVPTSAPSKALGPLNLYAVSTFTGPLAYLSVTEFEAMQAYVERGNARGGLLGRKVQILKFDDMGAVAKAMEHARIATGDPDHLFTMAHPYSALALPVSAVYAAHKKLMFTTRATNPSLSTAGPTVVQMSFNDRFQGRILAKFVRTSLRPQRVLVIANQSDPYSADLATEFIGAIADGARVERFDYVTGLVAWDELQKRQAALDPDVVFVPDAQGRVAEIVDAVRARTTRPIAFVGGDSWGDEGPLSVGIKPSDKHAYYYADTWHPDAMGERWQKVRELFDRSGRKELKVTPGAVIAYEALDLVWSTIEKLGTSDNEQVAAALRGLTYEGMTGKVEITRAGPTTRPIVVLQLRRDGATLLEVVAPDR